MQKYNNNIIFPHFLFQFYPLHLVLIVTPVVAGEAGGWPGLDAVEAVHVEDGDAEGWRPLVLVVVGHVHPHQDAAAPNLVAVARRELDHKPSLPPSLEKKLIISGIMPSNIWCKNFK